MATKLSAKGVDNLYTLTAFPSPTALVAPAIVKTPPNSALHQAINHSNSQALAHFRALYPDAFQEILERLPTVDFPCVSCVVGKAKRAIFPLNTFPPSFPLDAVSIDITGPINPPDL